MAMLHIKLNGITKYRNMVANILPADPHTHLTLVMGSTSQNSTFSEHGHFKLRRITNTAIVPIFFYLQSPPPPPGPGDGVDKSKFNFLEHGHGAF